MTATRFQRIRGDDRPNREQDNIGHVLDPLAKAVGNTPIMGAAPPPWILATLTGGYSQSAAPQAATAFHKDALGYVHAKVSLTHAAGCVAGTTALIFPIGYRPNETLTFAGSDAVGLLVAMTLTAAGVLANLAALAAGDQVRLNFIFLAEQ